MLIVKVMIVLSCVKLDIERLMIMSIGDSVRKKMNVGQK